MPTDALAAFNIPFRFTAGKERFVNSAEHPSSGNGWVEGAAFSVPGASPDRKPKAEGV
jgi:hypothetical protein